MGGISELPINTGSDLGSLLGVSASSGVLGEALSTISGAIPFVGPIIKLITSFIGIGGGCGETCIASAKGEQVFEVAGDDILHTVKSGMLDAQDGLALLGTLLSQGQAFMSKLISEGDTKAQGGLTNMTNVLNNLAQTMSQYGKASQTLDITAAQKLYISTSNQGWYVESVVAGNTLATQMLQTYLQSGLSASENTDLSGVLDSVLSGLTNELQSAQNASSSTMSGILGGISGLLGLAQASGTSTGTKVLSGILGTIGLSTNTATSIASDISSALNDVTKVVNTFNTNIVGKLINPVLKSINDATTLQGALEADLKNGLTGILQIPSQLGQYLNSQASITHQQTVLNNDNRTNVASEILSPGIGGAISGKLQSLHETISQVLATPQQAIQEFSPLPLSESSTTSLFAHDVNAAKDLVDNTTFMGIHVFKDIFSALIYLESWLALNVPAIKLAEQNANLAVKPAILGMGDIVSLLHRDLISWPQAIVEANKNGFDGTRLTSLYTVQDSLLGVREAVEASYRKIITTDALDLEFKYLNYDKGRQNVIMELAKFLPDVGTAANWFARNFITPEQFREILQYNRWSSDEINIAELALFAPANSAEYARFKARMEAASKGFLANAYGQEPPTDVSDINRQNQKSAAQAKLDWIAHWRDVDLFSYINGYYRSLINKDYYNEAIASLNYPPEVSEFLLDVNRPLIPFFYLTEMLAAGIFTEDQAIALLKQYGFNQDSIDASIRFGNFKALGKATDQNNALAQLSVSNLKSMYDEKIINKSQLIIALEEHGYNAEVSVLLADLYETQEQIKENTAYADAQVNLVKIGTLTKLQALDNLAARGFTQAQIAKYEVEIEKIKVTNMKFPTLAEFGDFWKKGLISDNDYLTGLELLGYNSQYANMFLAYLKV